MPLLASDLFLRAISPFLSSFFSPLFDFCDFLFLLRAAGTDAACVCSVSRWLKPVPCSWRFNWDSESKSRSCVAFSRNPQGDFSGFFLIYFSSPSPFVSDERAELVATIDLSFFLLSQIASSKLYDASFDVINVSFCVPALISKGKGKKKRIGSPGTFSILLKERSGLSRFFLLLCPRVLFTATALASTH